MIGAVELMANKESKTRFDPARKAGPRAVAKAIERGLILRARGDALTLCPPLIICKSEIDELFDKMTACLDDLADELAREN
jgi:4-aminobutyrate--pyruvate transaminase